MGAPGANTELSWSVKPTSGEELAFDTSLLPGPDLTWLAIIVSLDNLSGGFAATAFVAFLSGLTSKAYTATQYALFSSLMTLPGKFISGFSGFVVEAPSSSAAIFSSNTSLFFL